METEIYNDKQFEAHTIASATAHNDGWDVRFDGGTCLWVPNDRCQQAPIPGDTMRLYGRRFGYAVRGITIGENVYRYQTEAEADAERIASVEASKAKKVRDFEANLPTFEASVQALDAPFRVRMRRFLRRDGWGAEFGGYELFVCQEAQKIIARLRTVEEVKAFHAANCDAQKELVPELDADNHSGNTFGAATMLAHVYLTDKNLAAVMIQRVHGALCPLVGCTEYGCWATEQSATATAV
jgi:hypothetical protein